MLHGCLLHTYCNPVLVSDMSLFVGLATKQRAEKDNVFQDSRADVVIASQGGRLSKAEMLLVLHERKRELPQSRGARLMKALLSIQPASAAETPAQAAALEAALRPVVEARLPAALLELMELLARLRARGAPVVRSALPACTGPVHEHIMSASGAVPGSGVSAHLF